ncbi:MAG: LysM peptidoglycan-binding domain-containing protein [bacterium]
MARYRYRRSSYSYRGWSSPADYGGELKPAFDFVVAKFLAFNSADQVRAFADWKRQFGTNTAEQAYAEWRSGTRRMTQATREKVAKIVAPRLSVQDRTALGGLLWRPGQRVSQRTISISEPNELAKVTAEHESTLTRQRGHWLQGFPGVEGVLTPDVVAKVKGKDEEDEADVRAEVLRLKRAIFVAAQRPGPRSEATFDLPLRNGEVLTIVVTKKAHPIWRRLKPVFQGVAWAGVAAAIGVGVYVSNEARDEPARAAEPAPTTYSTARPSTPTPVVRIATVAGAATRSYTIVSGDSWTGIAARFGLTPGALYEANGLSGPTKALYAGTVILVPSSASSGSAGGSAGGAALAPSPTRTPTRSSVPTGPTIPYPGNGGGPTQCRDGSVSNSSGSGTCSHHGGIAR